MKDDRRDNNRSENGSRHKVILTSVLLTALAVGLWMVGKSVAGAVRLGDWSDAMRQWEVCQYLKVRVNPWEVAFRVLRETFGPVSGQNRVLMRETRIYSVNSANWRGDCGVLPGHPPPEATYPPSSAALLTATFGMLPKAMLLPVYAVFNILCLLAVVGELGKWFRRETRTGTWVSLGTVAVIYCLWPPVRFGILCGQPILFVLLCAWMAARKMEDYPICAGMFFAGALIKPSCSLLFAVLPLLRWRWKPLWTAFFICAGLFMSSCAWLGEWPWMVLGQWTGLCRYLLQGSFTLQEFINALAWDNTPMGWLVVVFVWGGTAGWCVFHRKARWERQFALLCLANLAWTYHERYDFALLAVPMVVFAADAWLRHNQVRGWTGLALCLVLGVAFTDGAYVTDAPWAQALRWGGRLSLLGLWGVTAVAVRQSSTAGQQ